MHTLTLESLDNRINSNAWYFETWLVKRKNNTVVMLAIPVVVKIASTRGIITAANFTQCALVYFKTVGRNNQFTKERKKKPTPNVPRNSAHTFVNSRYSPKAMNSLPLATHKVKRSNASTPWK